MAFTSGAVGNPADAIGRDAETVQGGLGPRGGGGGGSNFQAGDVVVNPVIGGVKVPDFVIEEAIRNASTITSVENALVNRGVPRAQARSIARGLRGIIEARNKMVGASGQKINISDITRGLFGANPRTLNNAIRAGMRYNNALKAGAKTPAQKAELDRLKRDAEKKMAIAKGTVKNIEGGGGGSGGKGSTGKDGVISAKLKGGRIYVVSRRDGKRRGIYHPDTAANRRLFGISTAKGGSAGTSVNSKKLVAAARKHIMSTKSKRLRKQRAQQQVKKFQALAKRAKGADRAEYKQAVTLLRKTLRSL